MHRTRKILLLFLLIVTLPATANTGDDVDCRRHRPTLREIMETLSPDVMPQRAHRDDQLYIQQPQVREFGPTFIGHHNDRYREGIDVSHYQGSINWQRVANEGGVSYVYIKATEGAELVDSYYATNIVEAHKAGLSVGSYHFYRPRADVNAQLANFTGVVDKRQQDLVPIIDIEDDRSPSEAEFIADLQYFIERVTKFYGRKPVLYTGQNFYNKHFQGLFPDYQWMIAKYQNEAPVLLDGQYYMMWQYTSKGKIPGINGTVDRSCLMGNSSLKPILM